MLNMLAQWPALLLLTRAFAHFFWQLGELEVLEIVEQLANPSKDEGEWIARIDLVESGTKLKLVEQARTA